MSDLAALAQAPGSAHPVAAKEREVLGVTNGKLAMWLFLGSDGMSFMGLIATYVFSRVNNWSDWPSPPEILNVPLTAVNTFILICSSVTMVKAFAAAQERNVGRLKLFLGLTMLGGAIFLGIQVYEYIKLISHEGLTLTTLPEHIIKAHPNASTLFGATFFACTCFHGCHVFSGVVYIGIILALIHFKDSWTLNRIELVGLYWHFVDLVWIIIFTIIYLF